MARGGWVFLGAVLLVSSPAMAQSPGEDAAAAQALFEDGKRLMQAGNYDEACPKLVESQRLDPGGGTLLAIGLCHEAQGKTATAWADFNLALSEARKDRRAERESAASEHIRALEKKMPRVRIVVTSKIDGLEIRRDGALVRAAQWGTALPIDPGEHRFEAWAIGKKPWERKVAMRAEAQTVEVTVPALEDAPAHAPAPQAPPTAPAVQPTGATPAPAPAPAAKTTDASAEGTSSSLRTWGFIVGGLGLASIGVGGAFGLSASSKWHDAGGACPNGKCTDPKSVQLGNDAASTADLSTVFFAAGAVGLAVGAVLLLVPAGDGPASPASRRLRVFPIVGNATGVGLGGRL